MPNYTAQIKRAARKWHVDPEILTAQLRQESGLREGLVSPAGARDIAQFMPATAKTYGVTLGDNRAGDDIRGAAHMMRDMLDRFGGDYRKALAAYNAGPGAVEKYNGVPPYQETQNYVKSILGAAGDPGQSESAPFDGNSSAPGGSRTVTDEHARRSAIIDYFHQRGKPGALQELTSAIQGAQSTESFDPDIEGPQSAPHAPQAPRDTDIVSIGHLAQRLGLHVGENEAFGGVNPVHVQGSNHYKEISPGVSGAVDVSGDPALMRKFARIVARRFGPDLEELIWRGAGARTKKNGQHVPKSFYTGHTDHVHVADLD